MKTKWVPAIAVGAIGRFGGQRVSYFANDYDVLPGATDKNADFYIVATKTVTQVKGLPFVLSFGEKVTNASIMGVAGNAGNGISTDQRWQGRLFGAAAFVVKGPSKSSLIFGSEVLQEPRYVQGLNQALGERATIPTSLDYFVRIVPHLEGSPLQIDWPSYRLPEPLLRELISTRVRVLPWAPLTISKQKCCCASQRRPPSRRPSAFAHRFRSGLSGRKVAAEEVGREPEATASQDAGLRILTLLGFVLVMLLGCLP